MKRTLCLVLTVVLTINLQLYAAVAPEKAKYVGGTAGLDKDSAGALSTENNKILSFNCNIAEFLKAAGTNSADVPERQKKEVDSGIQEKEPASKNVQMRQEKDAASRRTKGKVQEVRESWCVPYDKIDSISYGQHAGRRVGTSLAMVPLLGAGALAILFSKKRRHYISVGYFDRNGARQSAVAL